MNTLLTDLENGGVLPIQYWPYRTKPNTPKVRYRILYRDNVVNSVGHTLIDVPVDLMIFPDFWAWQEDEKIIVVVRIS